MGEGIELDIKRCYLPGKRLKDKCPKCGAECVYDLGESYLSYPVLNAPFAFTFYCGECEHEWERNLLLGLSVKMLTTDETEASK